jgi:hypothetical protein
VPTGTDAATRADVVQSSVTIKNAVDQQTAANATNAGAIITAVDKNSSHVVSVGNQTVSALNAINASLASTTNAQTSKLHDDALVAHNDSAALLKGLNDVSSKVSGTTAAVGSLTTAVTDRFVKISDAQTAANAANSSASSAGASAGAAAAGLFSSAGGVTTHGIQGQGNAPDLSVTMPPAFGGAKFEMNPFANDRFASICSWFRTACAWLAVIVLGSWVWSQLGQWVRGLAQVQQAKGNTIAGTGGQATGLIAAGLMTTAIVAAITALLGWSFGEVGMSAIRLAAATTNPLATIPAAVYWMCDQLLPVTTLCVCAVARVTFNMYAAPLYATCAAVVRFIVP